MVSEESVLSRLANSKAVQTLAVALGIVMLAEALGTSARPATKPKLRKLLKEAVRISDELKLKTEETREMLEDLLAEAREEYQAEKAAASQKGVPEAAPAEPKDTT
jgi:polyhydroxyalkanoate synthesis regulator phasin